MHMYAIDIDTSTCTYHLHVEMDIFLCGGSYNCASEQSKVVRTTTKASEALTRTDRVLLGSLMACSFPCFGRFVHYDINGI